MTVVTTQTLHNNQQSLGVFAATASSNIDKIHNKFDKNNSQLLARGASVDDPIGIIFDAYLVVPCYNFKLYICRQHKGYFDCKLTSIRNKAIMTSAKCKSDWLKTKGLLDTKFSNARRLWQ